MRQKIINAKFKYYYILCSLIICLFLTLSAKAAEKLASTSAHRHISQTVNSTAENILPTNTATFSDVYTITTSILCIILIFYILHKHSKRTKTLSTDTQHKTEEVLNIPDTAKNKTNPDLCPNSKSIEIISNNNDNVKQTNKNSFNAICNATFNGIIITDNEGKVIQINTAAIDIIDRPLQDIINCHISDFMQLFETDTFLMLEHPVITTLYNKQQVTLAEPCIFITDTGENKYLIIRTEPITSDSKIIGTILILKDATEEHHLKQQVNKANKLESIGRHSGEIAHNFNNLLGGIMGFADLICINSKNSTITNYARNIIDTSERAAKLSAQLLTFSRDKNTTTKCIDVHRCIRQAMTILNSKFSGKITPKINLNAINHKIIGDSTLIQNCILNFGINASDAVQNNNKGVFSIETSERLLDQQYCRNSLFSIKPGKYISITIIDQYNNVPENTISEIFNTSLHDHIPEQFQYPELIKIFRKIISHNGAVEIKNNDNQSTEYILLLPLYFSNEISTKETAGKVEIKTKNILLVDDQPISRSLGQSILKEAGYNVMIAENGEQALKTYLEKGHIIDLIIMDLVMPVIGGLEATGHLLEMNPEVKIIIASGMGRSIDVDNLILDGKVKFFISKPFTNSNLIKTVANIL